MSISNDSNRRVGFIGLGVMGSRMAKNLLRAGYEVVVYNRSLQPVEELVNAGALPASSPQEVARQSNIIVLALLDSRAVESVVLGERGIFHGMSPGTIVIDTSTIDPATTTGMAEKLRTRGSYFLDAPVSGGPEGAAAGTLSIMVGGDRSAFDQAKEVISKMGKNVFYMGESGSGMRVKLFNQALVGVYFVAVAEAYLWAKKTGLKVEDLQKIISMSWGDSPVFRHVVATVISGDMKAGASMRNLVKDLDIILKSAKDDGARLTLLELADQYIARASEKGYEAYDASILYSILDQVRS